MRCRGMTLIELMVAMSIFLVLGAGLVMFLRVGIQTWRVGERRREVYERGQAILDQMAGDFSCTFSDPSGCLFQLFGEGLAKNLIGGMDCGLL